MKRPFEKVDDRHYQLGLFALSLALVGVAASLVIWHSFGVAMKLWAVLCAVLVPLVYGIMLCCMLAPLTSRMQAALPHVGALRADGVRRTVAAVGAIGLMAAVILAFIAMFSGMLTVGVSRISLASLPSVADMLEMMTSDVQGFVTRALAWLSEMGIDLVASEGRIMSLATDAAGLATTATFATMFAAYFLIDGERIMAYIRRVLHAVDGKDHDGLTQVIDDANRVFTGYFCGQAIDAMFMAVTTSVVLMLIGVPYAPVVGMLCGAGNFIPYVGPIVGYASIAVACLIDGAWVKLVWGIVAMAVIGFIDGNIVNPRLLSANVEVHPAVVMAALIAGGVVGGVTGMLVAVPTAALIKLQVDRWLEASEAEREPVTLEAPEQPVILDGETRGSR